MTLPGDVVVGLRGFGGLHDQQSGCAKIAQLLPGGGHQPPPVMKLAPGDKCSTVEDQPAPAVSAVPDRRGLH